MAADVAPGQVEQSLLQYLEMCCVSDAAIDVEEIRGIAASAAGPLNLAIQTEDQLSLLHLAVLNEVTEADALGAALTELLQMGVPADIKDGDGDTVLETIIALGDEAERDGEGLEDRVKMAHLCAITALLRSPSVPIGTSEVTKICSWLRRTMPEEGRDSVLNALADRGGSEEVARMWCSEQLLAHLEQRAYEMKKGVKAAQIADFLSRGASPRHTQNGATAILLVVLNPYTEYQEALEVFRLMLTADPGCASIRDGFKLTPLEWASDYNNVAQQHGMTKANPGILLALMPNLVLQTPLDVDSGECCLKTNPGGACSTQAGKAPATRFMEGDRVVCRVSTPGHGFEWEEGVIVGLWYRESCYPREHCGAPYEMLLDIGTRVYALVDHDRIVRREEVKQSRPVEKVAPTTKVASSGSRFKKQQREDGSWEILDTVSGKSRPIPPPDSDDSDDA